MPSVRETLRRPEATRAEALSPKVAEREIFSAKTATRKASEASAVAELRKELKRLSPPVYNAEFPIPLKDSLRRSGIAVEYVDPVPIGRGEGYEVFLYAQPDMHERVVKIPRRRTIASMTQNRQEEEENYQVAKAAFADYIPDTYILSDPQSPLVYYVVQDKVEGKKMSNIDVRTDEKVRIQLEDIAARNRQLHAEKKLSLDFAGWAGFVRGVKKVFSSNKELESENIIVDSGGKLKIVDYEILHLGKEANIFRRMRDSLYLLGNKWVMSRYYDTKIAS